MQLTSLTRSRSLLLAAVVAGASLLMVACDGTDAAEDEATPTPTATASPTPSGTMDPTGGGIEPANPEEPPLGDATDGNNTVPLGLGSYCWSPPTGSGKPALCADAMGIITGIEDLVTSAGATITVTGDLTFPPMSLASALLYDAAAEPIAEGDDFRAWQPAGEERMLDAGEHSTTLPEGLDPGRYVLMLNYTAGPDRGSDATYGVLIVIE